MVAKNTTTAPALLDAIMRIPGATTRGEVDWLVKLAGMAPTGGVLVDLGTYNGRSAAALAMGAPQHRVVTVDDYSHRDDTKSSSTKTWGYMTELKCQMRVEVVQSDTRLVPPNVGRVALLYVDSNHTRAHFDAEMEAWLPRLVPGAIVAAHDYQSWHWPEITGAVDHWLHEWARIGQVRYLVAHRRPAP